MERRSSSAGGYMPAASNYQDWSAAVAPRSSFSVLDLRIDNHLTLVSYRLFAIHGVLAAHIRAGMVNRAAPFAAPKRHQEWASIKFALYRHPIIIKPKDHTDKFHYSVPAETTNISTRRRPQITAVFMTAFPALGTGADGVCFRHIH